MKQDLLRFATIALLLAISSIASGSEPSSKGLQHSSDFFPVGVWLQDPSNARAYGGIGINIYVGLWKGPTEEQLNQLDRSGIRVICGQNERSLKFLDRKTIAGWMHGDEPDNAQSLGQGKGYGPPILPSKIIEDYNRIRKADPDRPILLNLGQGVAWDGYYGRGVRTNHPEDYREYAKGGDIVSFDIYPAAHENKEIAGKLEYVTKGVDRLRSWTDDSKQVWCCIETTRINNLNRKPSPIQVRSEVWMALIHGAKGIIYFSHQFKPKFIEAGLLADQEMAREVKSINQQIHQLAPVLNQPDVNHLASVESLGREIPIDFMVKQHADKTYIFAASMRDSKSDVLIKLQDKSVKKVKVVGENRSIETHEGQWTDQFIGYGVHIYEAEK